MLVYVNRQLWGRHSFVFWISEWRATHEERERRTEKTHLTSFFTEESLALRELPVCCVLFRCYSVLVPSLHSCSLVFLASFCSSLPVTSVHLNSLLFLDLQHCSSLLTLLSAVPRCSFLLLPVPCRCLLAFMRRGLRRFTSRPQKVRDERACRCSHISSQKSKSGGNWRRFLLVSSRTYTHLHTLTRTYTHSHTLTHAHTHANTKENSLGSISQISFTSRY